MFSKHHFYVCLFLSFSCIRIFQHIVIFHKSNIPSGKLRSCLYKVTLCLIKKMFLLKALWKVEQVLSFLQHRVKDLAKHGWHFPLLNLFTFKFFLLSKTFLPPIISLKVFFSFSAKISFNFGWICKICQFLSMIVLRSGRVLLYKTVSSKRSVLDVLILFSDSIRGIEIARLICVAISVLL